jgi:hypothetical protein
MSCCKCHHAAAIWFFSHPAEATYAICGLVWLGRVGLGVGQAPQPPCLDPTRIQSRATIKPTFVSSFKTPHPPGRLVDATRRGNLASRCEGRVRDSTTAARLPSGSFRHQPSPSSPTFLSVSSIFPSFPYPLPCPCPRVSWDI